MWGGRLPGKRGALCLCGTALHDVAVGHDEVLALVLRLALGAVLDMRKISSYNSHMARRRVGALLPIEERILEAGIAFGRAGEEFHGFALAAAMSGRDDGRGLTAHGTLYKALGRLSERGLLTSRWEDADLASAEGRPRRRLYRVTGAGEAAWRDGSSATPARRSLGTALA
jgi:PadR family transcriptional regulator, regulatory protein PadR